MPAPITTELVWSEIEKRSFAVLSYVTPRGEARSSGIVYVVVGRKFYIRVASDSWKAKHIGRNPNVALNVTIPKRVPLMPWIQIPQATVALQGTARLLGAEEVGQPVLDALDHATAHEPEGGVVMRFLEVSPRGHFATYGVGVSLLTMRDPERARGRVAVAREPAS
jgi:hypothetical protein